jgi:glycosyltransferase involved in cell wall biosynthesis
MTNTRIPKNVIFVTEGFRVGGSESFLVNLLNELSRDRVNPIVFSLSETGDLEKKLHPSIAVRRILKRWRYDLTPAARIASLMKKEDIPSAFALGLYPFFYIRLASALAKKRPRVFISLHSTKPRSTKNHLQRICYTKLLRKDDILVGVCHSQAKYISEKYNIPFNRFRVIYNGVDPNHWTLPPDGFDRLRVRADLRIPEAADVIIQVAAFRVEKRHEDSLRALAIVHNESKRKPYLLFVGAGSREIEERCRRLADQIGISAHVIFCGQQSDVRPFYWISDLFTLSSNSVETFSIAALEAMACGLPCVLTDLGGAREMIVEGTNGYVVPPEQPQLLAAAWLRVLEKKNELLRNMIRERVTSQFSLAGCVQSYEQLLSIS